MKRKVSARHICFIIIVGLIVFASFFFFLQSPSAERSTLSADDAIATGKTQLFQKTVPSVLAAYQTFENAYTTYYAGATVEQKIKIRSYLALTRLLDLAFRDDGGSVDTLTEILGTYGITRAGNDLDTFEYKLPLNADDKLILPATAPSGEAIRGFLAGPFLTAVNASLADMDDVISKLGSSESKEIISKTLIDAADPSQKDVEVDNGDYYLFRATLKALKVYALIISAYDLNINIREIAALGNNDALNFKQLLERNTNLLKLLTPGSTPGYDGAAKLTEAKTALKEAINDYLMASDKIRNDSDTTMGAEELISLSPDDVQDEAKFRTNMTSLRDSLVNSNTADMLSGTSDHIYLNLNPFFGGAVSLRDILPEFSDYGWGQPVPGTMAHGLANDPTLGGIFPDYTTQDRWTREMSILQPLGLVTIPTATINVQDGSVGDWDGISPSPLIFTDVTGDAKDNPGLDISKVYLAKDGSNLYIRMDMAGTIPQSGNEWVRYHLKLKKLPGDQYDLPGDVKIFVQYNPWTWPTPTWQASVGKFDSNLNLNPVYTLNFSSFQIFGNIIEIAAPLSQAGEIAGRFINVSTEKWSNIDNNPTNLQISPVATLTGTLTVPQYDGTGSIYVGVFQYNSSFTTDSQRRIGGKVIYPDQYTAGMTYTINNLSVGERVFVTVFWDKDGNGIVTPGDYTNFYSPFTLAAGVNTKNLTAADDHPAYEAPQLIRPVIFSIKYPNASQAVYLTTFLKGPSPDDVTITVTGPGGTFTLQPTIFTNQAGRGLGYTYTIPWLIPNGDYVFEAVDSLGRKVNVTYHYQYNGTIPSLNNATFVPSNYSYVGTTAPTLSWQAPGSGAYFYMVYILDSGGKACWYMSPMLSTTSVTVPSGVLQPNTPYKWFVRIFDNGTSPMNSMQSSAENYFYTGSYAANPAFSFARIISMPPTGAITVYWHFIQARVPGVAPWDVTYYRLKDPSGNILYQSATASPDIRMDQSSFFSNVYSTATTLPLGNYTIEMMTNHSAQPITRIIPYQFNAVQAVDITALIPSNNYYFNTLTPTFSWASVADQNTYYRIRINDPMNKIVVWQSDFSKNTSVTVPEGILLPGGTYSWTVMTSSDYDPSRSTATGQWNSATFVNTEGSQNNYAAFRFTIISSDLKGDINNDTKVDLNDAILALQVAAGLSPPDVRSDFASSGADVDADGKLGLPEIIYIIQKAAQLR